MRNFLPRLLKNPRFWLAALALYWVALFVGTHIPVERVPDAVGSADKIAHFLAFGTLAMIFAATWQTFAGRLKFRKLVWIWVIIATYGALEELTQPFVNRVASIYDWLADISGAAIGLAVFHWGPSRWLSNLSAPLPDQDPPPPPQHRYRFSLRALFVLMTLVALASYWLVLPTLNAQRFIHSLQHKDYATADRLFFDRSNSFPGSFKEHSHFETSTNMAPLTWSDILNGKRHINIAIDYGDGDGIVGCGVDVTAHRNGLELGLVMP